MEGGEGRLFELGGGGANSKIYGVRPKVFQFLAGK